MQPTDVTPRRRLRLLLLALLGALFAAPAALYFVLSWAGQHDLDLARAEADALDPNWRFADLMARRKTYPEEKNSALVVLRAAALLPPAGFDLGAKNHELFENYPAAAQLNDAQVAVLRKVFKRMPEAVGEARKVRDFPEGRYTIQYDPDWFNTRIDPINSCRNVMALLEHDTILRAHDNDAKGAMESLHALFFAGRSIGDEPLIIAILVQYAGHAMMAHALERVLAQGRPDTKQLKAFQDLLEAEIDVPLLLIGMRGERAGGDIFLERIRHGEAGLFTTLKADSGMTDRFLQLMPGLLARNQAAHLRLMNDAVEIAKLPPEKQEEPMAQFESDARDAPMVPRLLLPALSKVSAAGRRSQALLRSMQAAVAAERYRQQNDRWPATRETLVKEEYLKAWPTDPYEGQPLRWRRLPDGVVIYSVSHDKTDDGGTINRDNALAPGTDVGLRLWDVEARRQPPLAVRPDPNDDP
jgi:hypothetical protein